MQPWAGSKIDKVAGIEARGFILGGAVAHQVSAGFVPIRKKGKLPFKRVSIGYSLEYGIDEMEMHEDAVLAGERVILVDDLVATGGTAEAACKLLKQIGADVLAACFIIDLPDLGGAEKIRKLGVPVRTLVELRGALTPAVARSAMLRRAPGSAEAASDELSRPISSRNSSSRNPAKIWPIQWWISVGPPRCSVHIGGEREIRPVDHAAHDRRKPRDDDQAAVGARQRKIFFVEMSDAASLCTGTNVAAASRSFQFGIVAHGRRRRVGDEQNDGLDRAPLRFPMKPISRHDREELLERPVAEVDHLVLTSSAISRSNNSIWPRVRRCRPARRGRETAGEHRVARVEVVADKRPAGTAKIRSSSRAISVLPMRGCGDVMM